MTDPLVAFLTARLDEAEAATNARRSLRADTLPLRCPRCNRPVDIGYTEERGTYYEPCGHPLPGDFWDTHTDPAPDPAVLADVAAKRAITRLHTPRTYETFGPDGKDRVTTSCIECVNTPPCATLRHLASVYATHPGYDPAWRP